MDTSRPLHDRIFEHVRREFQAVEAPKSWSLDDYIYACGQARDALLYVSLFCPALEELDGCVLMQSAVEEETDRRRFSEYRAANGKRAAESSFNFVEVPDLFGAERRSLSEDGYGVLAAAIAASWRAWLAAQHPNRKFVVEVLGPEQTGSTVGIHFFEQPAVAGGQLPDV